VSLDPLSLLIGVITGGLLSGFVPILTWFLQTKKDREDQKVFLGFLGQEHDARLKGQKNFWWNPPISEKKYHKVLTRMVFKGILNYDPDNGYRLKQHL